ncbi:hypothetical protein [Photorhabdus sp. SF281]
MLNGGTVGVAIPEGMEVHGLEEGFIALNMTASSARLAELNGRP